MSELQTYASLFCASEFIHELERKETVRNNKQLKLAGSKRKRIYYYENIKEKY